MNRLLPITLALIACAIAIAVPIRFSLYYADRESLEIEKEQALVIAREVLRRAEVIGDQSESAAERLTELHLSAPCSSAAISAMRDIDVSSSYLQMVGYVSNNHLICSSLGRHDPPINLGPVDYVSSRDAEVRIAVELPFALGKKFVVGQRGSYAAFIHRDLATDVFVDRKDVSLGIYGQSSGRLLTYRGQFNPDWKRHLNLGQSATYFDGRHVVAVLRSSRYDYSSYVALPVAYLNNRVRNLAYVLVPLGLLVGVLLAGALAMLVRQHMSLPSAIRHGIKRKEFFVMYQPIVDLQSGQCVGVEALLRWRRKNGTLIRPDLFIPVAEEYGLIKLLTQQAMDLAAHDIPRLLKRYPDFRVGFNLSSSDLETSGILQALTEFLRVTGIKPQNIVAEATERELISPEVNGKILKDIRAMGIQVAIDDFGTGYSSLSYLATLEVDYLKIDKSFVDAVDKHAATSEVALHIIGMAKSLNLAITAEGVETHSQADFLRRHGVRYAQGWLFGKPMLIDELEKYLESNA